MPCLLKRREYPSWRTLVSVCAIATGLVLASPDLVTRAAPPTIGNLSLRGLQTGATTTLVIDGAELAPEAKLLLAVPIAQQTVKPGATASQVQIDVTLDAGVAPGVYQLRLATAGGVSAPVAIGVDRLPELPFAAEVSSLPVALNGTLQGAAVLRTSFTGLKGQAIVIDVEGRRLGVELNPVLHLLDSRNVQLAWAQPTLALAGDARIAAVLPADGRYTVELHDALYRGPAPGAFRLKIGSLPYADLTFPLAVKRGAKTALEFVSTNLPAEARAEAPDVPSAGEAPAPWPALEFASGVHPRLVYSEHDEAIETAPAPGQLQQLAPPIGVSGRLAAARETDRYQLAVTPGQALRIDVLAARAGSPLDGVLTVNNPAGGELARSDDRPNTTDPGLDFTVPAGVSAVVLSLKDLEGRGGPNYVYRIAVEPLGLPDYSLSLMTDREALPKTGASLLRVRANRAGYNGPIRLSIPGLPAGVTVTGDEIPAGATDALVTLLPGDQVAPPIVTMVVGDSTEPNTALRRVAVTGETLVSKAQPWLRRELALAGAQASPISIAWANPAAEPKLPLGSSVPFEVQIARAAGVAGPVRLSLVTTQSIPKKTIKENNQDKQVDDLDRALRLDSQPTIAAEQTSGAATVLVPGDLPNIPYDAALQAELLSADGKTVLASALTPARRMTPASPFVLAIAGEAKVDAKAGSGETGKLTGTIQRLGDFKQPLSVTLVGLPADLPPPEVTLAPEQNEFSLPVAFPYGTAPGAVANVKLVAASRLNPTTFVRSNELPVAVNVVPGGPPPALYKLFEDESSFLTLLNEGGGQATLETADRYSGQAAMKVTPDQKFRAKLPGLGVKIAENPGEGEYRFLRFAWKKRGGANILLQLNANGAFGPLAGAATPAYRYEAGGPNPYKAAAIKLDEKLPGGWTVVTRDLFADFGAFSLDGLAFTASDGEAALFDHVYLARTADDLKGCPAPLPAEPPLAVFEDQAEFVAALNEGDGAATLLADDKFSGAASVKVTPGQRFNPMLPGLGLKIRQNPGPGEYRYLQFAWKKQGGSRICVQLNHDGQWGPAAGNPAKFRYDAGPAPDESYGAALRVDQALPAGFTLVMRDLFADFGEFTLTGLALSPVDGEFALFDHIYLGRSTRDFELAKP